MENEEYINNTAKILCENGYENVIIFVNPDYDDAFIGITPDNRAVYDFELMIQWLIDHEEMDEESAIDFICYNDSFSQEGYPIIYYGEDFDDEYEDDPDYQPLVFIRLVENNETY